MDLIDVKITCLSFIVLYFQEEAGRDAEGSGAERQGGRHFELQRRTLETVSNSQRQD